MPATPLDRIAQSLTATAQALAKVRSPMQVAQIARIAAGLAEFKGSKDIVWVAGNGGSQAAAQHLVLHLREHRIRTFDLLADNASLTALANDSAYQYGPDWQLKRMLRPHDAIVVISGSGRSENVFKAAFRVAASHGKVYGLLGMDGA